MYHNYPPKGGKRLKIIIVDDERNARESLENQMKQIPQITGIAMFQSPYEAIDYVRKNPVDVAFLDIEMPEINGIQMAMRLKAINTKINIVFVTGYSQYAAEAFDTEASDYLLKPATVERIQTALMRLRNPVLKPTSRIRIQTFGNFEVFADDKPVIFSRAKSKELLAYLIDRKGAGVTKKELSVILWEDDDYSRKRQTHLQILVSEMMKTLAAVDAGHIITKGYNSLAVDKTKFDCDFYRYLEGESRAFNMYIGEYMANYSWAEFTNAALDMM